MPNEDPIPEDHHFHHHITEEIHHHDLDQKDPHFQINNVVSNLIGTSNPNHADSHHQPHHLDHVEEPLGPIPANQLQLEDHNHKNNEVYPPLGSPDEYKGPPYPLNNLFNPEQSQPGQIKPSQDHPGYNYEAPSLPNVNHFDEFQKNPAEDFKYLPPKPHHPPDQFDVQIDISDGSEIPKLPHQSYSYPGFDGPLKIPIIASLPSVHMAKHFGMKFNPFQSYHPKPLQIGPSYEIHPSVGYELQHLRRRRLLL